MKKNIKENNKNNIKVKLIKEKLKVIRELFYDIRDMNEIYKDEYTLNDNIGDMLNFVTQLIGIYEIAVLKDEKEKIKDRQNKKDIELRKPEEVEHEKTEEEKLEDVEIELNNMIGLNNVIYVKSTEIKNKEYKKNIINRIKYIKELLNISKDNIKSDIIKNKIYKK